MLGLRMLNEQRAFYIWFCWRKTQLTTEYYLVLIGRKILQEEIKT